MSKEDEILKTVGEKLSTPEDEFNIIGKNIAVKLRRMPKETKIYTEKLINDLLFQAELGQIDEYTIISRVNTSTHNNIRSTYNRSQSEIYDFGNVPITTVNTLSTFNYPQSNISGQDNPNFPSCSSDTSGMVHNSNTKWTTSTYFASFQPKK